MSKYHRDKKGLPFVTESQVGHCVGSVDGNDSTIPTGRPFVEKNAKIPQGQRFVAFDNAGKKTTGSVAESQSTIGKLPSMHSTDFQNSETDYRRTSRFPKRLSRNCSPIHVNRRGRRRPRRTNTIVKKLPEQEVETKDAWSQTDECVICKCQGIKMSNIGVHKPYEKEFLKKETEYGLRNRKSSPVGDSKEQVDYKINVTNLRITPPPSSVVQQPRPKLSPPKVDPKGEIVELKHITKNYKNLPLTNISYNNSAAINPKCVDYKKVKPTGLFRRIFALIMFTILFCWFLSVVLKINVPFDLLNITADYLYSLPIRKKREVTTAEIAIEYFHRFLSILSEVVFGT